jgi:hypothetical protein
LSGQRGEVLRFSVRRDVFACCLCCTIIPLDLAVSPILRVNQIQLVLRHEPWVSEVRCRLRSAEAPRRRLQQLFELRAEALGAKSTVGSGKPLKRHIARWALPQALAGCRTDWLLLQRAQAEEVREYDLILGLARAVEAYELWASEEWDASGL